MRRVLIFFRPETLAFWKGGPGSGWYGPEKGGTHVYAAAEINGRMALAHLPVMETDRGNVFYDCRTLKMTMPEPDSATQHPEGLQPRSSRSGITLTLDRFNAAVNAAWKARIKARKKSGRTLRAIPPGTLNKSSLIFLGKEVRPFRSASFGQRGGSHLATRAFAPAGHISPRPSVSGAPQLLPGDFAAALLCNIAERLFLIHDGIRHGKQLIAGDFK